jgi:predicted amidophosphoribosyltransferase
MTAIPLGYVSRDDPTDDGARRCPICATALTSTRATYCSNAHRQAAFRRRRSTPPPPPVRLPVHFIVYQCPQCDLRLLGERRCPECNLWCRRLGAGDACPHCGDPVAVSDLLP